LLQPGRNMGCRGRSTSRDVSVSESLGRPSRLSHPDLHALAAEVFHLTTHLNDHTSQSFEPPHRHALAPHPRPRIGKGDTPAISHTSFSHADHPPSSTAPHPHQTPTQLHDPRVGFVTVTDVRTASDLRHARVYVSVLGEESAREASLEGLRSAHVFLQGLIATELKLKHTPSLEFFYDDSVDRGMRISQMLNERQA